LKDKKTGGDERPDHASLILPVVRSFIAAVVFINVSFSESKFVVFI